MATTKQIYNALVKCTDQIYKNKHNQVVIRNNFTSTLPNGHLDYANKIASILADAGLTASIKESGTIIPANKKNGYHYAIISR